MRTPEPNQTDLNFLSEKSVLSSSGVRWSRAWISKNTAQIPRGDHNRRDLLVQFGKGSGHQFQLVVWHIALVDYWVYVMITAYRNLSTVGNLSRLRTRHTTLAPHMALVCLWRLFYPSVMRTQSSAVWRWCGDSAWFSCVWFYQAYNCFVPLSVWCCHSLKCWRQETGTDKLPLGFKTKGAGKNWAGQNTLA